MLPDPLMVIAHPPAAFDDPALIFQDATPGELVLCCLCRSEDGRRKLLRDMRFAAGQPSPEADRREEETRNVVEAFADAWEREDYAAALLAVIRWRCVLRGGPYHTYALRESDPPYPWRFLVTFEEQDAPTLRAAVAKVDRLLQDERERIMDFFGWGVGDDGA